MADLAVRLGIDPRRTIEPMSPTNSGMTISEFCRVRKLDENRLTGEWRVLEGEFQQRPALVFPTKVGPLRVKYLDGKKPKAGWLKSGGRAHWYGLNAARRCGGDVLYIVNGEPSVWACAQSGVPAVCTCCGESMAPTPSMVEELKETGFRRIRVVFDNDETGRRGASDFVATLTESALDCEALALPPELGPHADVDDLHRTTGDDGLADRLAELDNLGGAGESHGALAGLENASTVEEVGAALRALSSEAESIGPIDRGLLREQAVAALKNAKVAIGSPAKLVDTALRRCAISDSGDASRPMILSDPEPWDEPVDGAELVNELVETILRYVVMKGEEALAVVLWILHSHSHDAFDISPLLAFVSPEKRCGKTLALDVTSCLVPRPLPASNVTAAALFRTVEKHRPTILVDEADTFLRDNDELRGVLNSGHRRATAIVIRCVGDVHEPTSFSTWSPKAVALIGVLSSTLEDRSIVISMRRRADGETVERWRSASRGALEPLRRRAARWVADHLDDLTDADPGYPDALNDRAADNWRPLLAIADEVGGKWPARARSAALELQGGEPDSESLGVMLLTDLSSIFQTRGNQLTSAIIVEALAEMEDRPWSECCRGKSISTTYLANKLRPYRIRPKQFRDERGKKVRGYWLSDCTDAFARYVPDQPVQSVHETEISSYEDLEPVQDPHFVPDRVEAKSCGGSDVPDVPDRITGCGDDGCLWGRMDDFGLEPESSSTSSPLAPEDFSREESK